MSKNSCDQYAICNKTVMDISDPLIRFDADGVSNHYWDFQNYVKPYWREGREGRILLEKTVDQIKQSGKGKDFDCLIGISGGADSSFMIHKMVSDFDLRPLIFHVDGGWNSETAVGNINKIVEGLGLDLFTEVINWEEMRDFQLAMFKAGVPHLDIPQDLAFIGVLYKFAEIHGIKYILNGGNISTESVLMPLQYVYWGTDMVHNRDIISKFGTVPMRSYPFCNILYHKLFLRYFRGVKVFKPLNFMPYIKKEAIKEMQRIYGWKPVERKHFESLFTRFFEGFWLPSRFNYDMRRNQLSSLILSGQITRVEALKELEQPCFDSSSIKREFEYIASKLDISVDELHYYHGLPKKFYWDYKNAKIFFDLGETVLSWLKGGRRGGAF